MPWYELVAAVLSAVGVWLAARQNIWTWPVAMAGVAIYTIVYFDARLYADMGLAAFYFITSGYGWYEWLFGGKGGQELAVSHTKPKQWLYLTVFVLVFTFGLGYFLENYTNADLSYIDAATTGVSLAAYWLMARKKVENWLIWIVVDTAYVGVYYYKELYISAVLYFVFVVLATKGYIDWKKELTQKPEEVHA